jgi:hypothetical protein
MPASFPASFTKTKAENAVPGGISPAGKVESWHPSATCAIMSPPNFGMESSMTVLKCSTNGASIWCATPSTMSGLNLNFSACVMA